MTSEVDVVVVGAGLSGLSAARLLKAAGLKVKVVEARDRVGGRTLTQRDPISGRCTDLGGAYIGPTQRNVVRLAEELGVELFKIYDEGKTVLRYKGVWRMYEGTVPPLTNPLQLLDVNHLMRTVDQLAREVSKEHVFTFLVNLLFVTNKYSLIIVVTRKLFAVPSFACSKCKINC